MKPNPNLVTLDRLNGLAACQEGVEWFKSQEEQDGIKILTVLLNEKRWWWFGWLAVRIMTQSQRVRWAVFSAEQVIEIFEKKYPEDKRPRNAIEAAKEWLKNPSDASVTSDDATYAAYAAASDAAATADDATSFASAAASFAAAAAAAASFASSADAACTTTDDADDAYDAAACAVAHVSYDSASDVAADRQKMRIKCGNEAIRILKEIK